MMFMRILILCLVWSFSGLGFSQQPTLSDLNKLVKPRMRVMIDNDLGGDPDGLFQLAHHLMSPP